MVTEPEIKEYLDTHFEEIMRRHMGIEGPFQITSEYSLPNGQLVDKVVIGTDNKVLALFECKGEVGTNAFVGGIGQAIEGAFHIKKNIRDDFSESAKSFLVVPIEMANNISLDLFNFPDITLLFVDISNNTTVEHREGSYISNNTEEWVTINPYYFRDCSLEGVYFYLKLILKNSGIVNRQSLLDMEREVRRVRDESNLSFFGDIRNNHIVPSVLGFYDQSSKKLTIRGYEFAKKSFVEFCKSVILKELGEYSKVVFLGILRLALKVGSPVDQPFAFNTQALAEEVKNFYDGKNITYLADPDGGNRNLLTMIRMLETIGAVERINRDIKINYYPLEGLPFKMEDYNQEYKEKLRPWFEKFGLDF